MKNNILKIILILILNLFIQNICYPNQFNFDVTEIEITENGNKFIGKKRGLITTDDGIEIDANQFEYDKKLNILNAKGNVKISDNINKYIIYTDKVIYYKNDEKIFTQNNSKGIDLKNDTIIKANTFEYDLSFNILSAKGNVYLEDKEEDYKLRSEFLKYFKNDEKIATKGNTTADIKSKYYIKSKDITFLRDEMEISSNNKTIITDKLNLYNLSKFKYLINVEELRGEKITISSNYKTPKSDNFYFSSAIINLKNQNFIAKNTEIKVHKDIFDNSENDPRLKGVSSSKEGEITTVNKGVFTSCKINNNCPAWAIQASEIKHDKKKQEISYKNAILKVFDIPVLYFPKFFHPDPTVIRKSGILKPVLNNSNVLGSSFTIPYYHVISDESDVTLAPTLFDSGIKMVQNEYRKVGKSSDILINFGHTRDYKSSTQNTKKNITYLFSKVDFDLDLENFNSSKMFLNLEKVTNDTFLKIFDTTFNKNTTSLKPNDNNKLSSSLKFVLNHDSYNLTTGFQAYENLQKSKNDRYQYVLPYYDLNKTFFPKFINGSINLTSGGSNDLNNTNQLKTTVTNNLSYSSLDFISKSGFKNNFNISLKNLNSVGKNVSEYKNNPQIELSSLFEVNTSIPLRKKTINYLNSLTPKISIRANPGDMKNHSNSERTINTDNIFSLDRLGLDDSYEAGKSLTIGIDYKKQMLNDMNKYFEIKLASVLRDKEESFMPSKTTLNKKSSNIFGSLSSNYIKNFDLKYKFALDNNLDEMEYNDVSAKFSLNNFVTSFNLIKEKGEMGDENYTKNYIGYTFNDQNQISFNTRRNRRINLTEFYNLVYEYKNDCLVAGINYKKTYYEDRDLKPTEDLLFTITLFPLTTFEQKIDQ